jgi:predicted nucleic acid-binding Zn ribbon protein
MPIYEYRCENDHRFELIQKFTDDAISVAGMRPPAARAAPGRHPLRVGVL